jgi:type VI protein secretion system component Hcp
MRRLILTAAAALLAAIAAVVIGWQQFSPTGVQTVASASTMPQCVNPAIYLNVPSLNALEQDGTAIPIQSIVFGVSSSLSGGTRTVHVSDVQFERVVDSHTLDVFRDMISGEDLGTVTALFFDTDSSGHPVQCESVTFFKADFVTSEAHGGAAGAGTPEDLVSLAFAAMTVNTGGTAISWDFETGTGGPTDSRVMRVQQSLSPHRVVFRWMVSSNVGIAGFFLSAGKERLGHGLVKVHHLTTYRAAIRTDLRGPFSLHTVLNNGKDIVTGVK